MKKINFSEIENVMHSSFEYHGEKWTLADYPRNQGTSSSGLWNDMTNGNVVVRIYKMDVLKIDSKKAVALFN